MEKVIEKIVDFASKLDKKSFSKEANAVDDIALNLIKVSQYVGSQGYWIRNERCWSNCYREKRASSPNKPTQEIWFDCQAEYEDAINNENSDWDSYAGNNVKVANTSLDVKIADSFRNDGDVESIISSFILQAENSHKEACLSAVEQVLTIADDLYGKDESLHNEATNISDLLLKEAGWWDTWDKANAWTDVAKQWYNKQTNPSGTQTAPPNTYRDFANQRQNIRQQVNDLNKQKGFRTDPQGKPVPLNAPQVNGPQNPTTDFTNSLNKMQPEGSPPKTQVAPGSQPVSTNAQPVTNTPVNGQPNQQTTQTPEQVVNPILTELNGIKNQLSALQDKPTAFNAVKKWILENGWQDSDAANNFAQWLVNSSNPVKASKLQKNVLFKI